MKDVDCLVREFVTLFGAGSGESNKKSTNASSRRVTWSDMWLKIIIWEQNSEQIRTTLLLRAEKAMAPHSSTLAWKIPWTEEPGRLQSLGSLRVRHDWVTSLSLFTSMHWRKKWQPTPVFLPGESQGRGAWWAAVDGVAQSRTRLKQLSSSSSSSSLETKNEWGCYSNGLMGCWSGSHT